MKSISWRAILIGVVLIAAVIYVLPTIKPGIWPHNKINLGLDLQGGMHLVLEVDTQKAVEGRIDRVIQEISDQMRKERIRYTTLDRVKGDHISIVVRGKTLIERSQALLDDEFAELREVSRNMDGETLSILLNLPDAEAERIRTSSTAQALETIRNRIDQFGVSEPDIRRQGDNRILIQLPGIKDTQRAKDLIGKTALLEFRLVDDNNDVQAAIKGDAPRGSEVLYEQRFDAQTQRTVRIPMLIKKRAVLTGASLTDARVEIDSQNGSPHVAIKFDKKGGRIFAKVTEDNVGKLLAIVLDNTIYSAPRINSKIAGGQAIITGNFSDKEAKDLAIVLRAGALPAPVTILEERTVGPSLGADSIRMGIMSMLVGGLFVIVFMVIYYKTAGIIADVALALNILLIAAGLAGFQATLTLPGIAGIILTIGMAVDANVLIFERIREESRRGKTPRAAVDAGYNRATLTILDANVTTLIAAVVLFQFGTGPVKGFAITLCLGVVASLFTALIITRSIFDFLIIRLKRKQLSI